MHTISSQISAYDSRWRLFDERHDLRNQGAFVIRKDYDRSSMLSLISNEKPADMDEHVQQQLI
jgi:hypothetical protein